MTHFANAFYQFSIWVTFLFSYFCKMFAFLFYFRVAPMEDTQEIEEQGHEEVISDKTFKKQQETLDEILSRHR